MPARHRGLTRVNPHTEKLSGPLFLSLQRARARLKLGARYQTEVAETPFKSFFDNAVEGIFQTSADGHYLQANPMLAKIYGYESPAAMMEGLTDIGNQLYVDGKRRAEFRTLLQEEDAVLGFESQVRRKDGSVIWISENARAVRTVDGRLVGYEGTVLDITQRKYAEEELTRIRQRERSSAAKIQQTLLLGDPPRDIPWLGIEALTIASQHVDGDFYDFHSHDDSCVDILIGDVMGKGIPAALLGAAIKSRFLRALAQLVYSSPTGKLPEPEAVVGVIHNDLTAQFIGLEFFSTLCYMRFDRRAHMLTYVDCGHTKTIHWRSKTRDCVTLEGPCLPIGFSTKEVYTQNCTDFEEGDLFVCFSDGVTESADEFDEPFGSERLMATVADAADAELPEVIRRLRTAIDSHCGTRAFCDDLTIIVIRIQP